MAVLNLGRLVQQLALKEDVPVVILSHHFCTKPARKQKTKLSIKKIKEVQAFQRSSEGLYGRTLRTPKGKLEHHKASESLMEKKSVDTKPQTKSSGSSTVSDTSNVVHRKLSQTSVDGAQVNSGAKDTDRNDTSQSLVETITDNMDKSGSAMDIKSAGIQVCESTRAVLPLEMDTTLSEAIESITSFPLCGTSEKDSGISEVINKYVSGMKRNPSVGRILQETMSEESKAILERWMKKMIGQLGEQGFLDYKKALFENGHNFHAYVASELTRTHDVSLKPENEPLMESLGSMLNDISDVEKVESHVFHHPLGYMGVLDGVMRYRDERVLVEWKTADKVKATLDQTYDNPLQVAAYMGALNTDTDQQQVSQGLLVIAYRDGKPASVHSMSSDTCHYYWQFWRLRLQKYWKLKLSMD